MVPLYPFRTECTMSLQSSKTPACETCSSATSKHSCTSAWQRKAVLQGDEVASVNSCSPCACACVLARSCPHSTAQGLWQHSGEPAAIVCLQEKLITAMAATAWPAAAGRTMNLIIVVDAHGLVCIDELHTLVVVRPNAANIAFFT